MGSTASRQNVCTYPCIYPTKSSHPLSTHIQPSSPNHRSLRTSPTNSQNASFPIHGPLPCLNTPLTSSTSVSKSLTASHSRCSTRTRKHASSAHAGVVLDHAVPEDRVEGRLLEYYTVEQAVDGGEVWGREGEVVCCEDGVDMRGGLDVVFRHVLHYRSGGGYVQDLGVEEPVEDGAVGVGVCLEAAALHSMENGEDGGLLFWVGFGVEGARGVAEEAVEHDGEGGDVGGAGGGLHALQDRLDFGLVVGADGGPEGDVVGLGVEGEVLLFGPGKHGVGEVDVVGLG